MSTFGRCRIASFMCAVSVMLGCFTFGIDPVCLQAPLMDLHVYDESTGEVIRNAVIVATDGVYTTHLLLSNHCMCGKWVDGGCVRADGVYVGVYRAGTYNVTITADGYAPRVLEDIVRDNDDNVFEPMEVPMSREVPQ